MSTPKKLAKKIAGPSPYWERHHLDGPEWLESLGMDREEAREKARQDLWFLITEVLGYDRYYRPLHEPLCRQIETAPMMSLFLLPRDHLKTTTITVSNSVRDLLLDPNCRILISSNLIRSTINMVRDIKRHFQRNERLLFLFPEYRMPTEGKDKGRQDEFSLPCRSDWTKREPSITAAAVDVSMVSRHFDRQYLDDLQTDKNSKTAEALNAIRMHWMSLWPMLEPDGGKMFIIGTRWDQEDMYEYVIDKVTDLGPSAMMVLRSALERNRSTDELEPIYPKTDPGPKLFTRKVLQERRRSMGQYSFSAQFMNRVLADASTRICHPRQIIMVDNEPRRDQVNLFFFIDPAISTREDADRSALVIAAMGYDRHITVLEVIAGNLKPSDFAYEIYQANKRWRPKAIFCEANAWQTLYVDYMERMVYDHGERIHISEMPRKATESSIGRVLGLQPYFDQGLISWLKGGRGVDDAIKEVLHWTKARARRGRDDICSALSDAPREAWPPPRSQAAPPGQIPHHWAELRMKELADNRVFGGVRPNVRLRGR